MDYTKYNASDVSVNSVARDQGLRDYMISIYKYMALALCLTGGIAFLVASTPALLNLVFGSGLQWLFILAPLGVVMYMSFAFNSMSVQKAKGWFWFYSALMGVSLSSLFLIYTGESIARVFFITASVFGSMSLYGYTTKKDLTNFGSFLMMGLLGIIIASLVNMFMHSNMIQFVVSILGLFIFIGLTAYDTQKLKDMFYQVGGSGEAADKVAVFGALNLYLDFINIFIYLMQFLGNRK